MAVKKNGIIAISGLVGSGKNTVGATLCRELRMRQVDPTFKTLAEKEEISLMEFQEKAKKDENIDKKFDDALKAECAGGNVVVTTWLGPWMAPGQPFKVWLDVSEEIRARRISNREGIELQEALEHLKKRDADNRARYKKVYGIDILDHSKFDLVIKVTYEKPDQIVEKIIEAYHKRK